MNHTTTPMSKDAVKELSKIAKKVWVPLKDLLFWTWENVIVMKNNADSWNISKAMQEQQITMESKIEWNAMRTIINVPDNYESDEPIHFCFILDTKWTKQAVQPTWNIWKNAKVKLFAYCFWVEYEVMHWDGKKYFLDEWANLEIYEFNYNADESYMTVYNTFYAELKDNAYFKNYYVSTVWHLWHGNTKWEIYCKWKNAKWEFITKNRILDKDMSELDISIYLEWEESSWLIISKTATYEWWTNSFVWKLYGRWKDTKWHMECDEISLWNCNISTSPTLFVENPSSRLTHEASVWTIEKKAIENLMIKWFNEEEAVKFLVTWLLDSV